VDNIINSIMRVLIYLNYNKIIINLQRFSNIIVKIDKSINKFVIRIIIMGKTKRNISMKKN
jgi:hypothetical protein